MAFLIIPPCFRKLWRAAIGLKAYPKSCHHAIQPQQGHQCLTQSQPNTFAKLKDQNLYLFWVPDVVFERQNMAVFFFRTGCRYSTPKNAWFAVNANASGWHRPIRCWGHDETAPGCEARDVVARHDQKGKKKHKGDPKF